MKRDKNEGVEIKEEMEEHKAEENKTVGIEDRRKMKKKRG